MPAQDQSLDLGEKQVKDLIEPETAITWDGLDGTVTGTIKKLDSWPEWGAPDGGHFLPVELGEQYEGKKITLLGAEVATKTAQDRKWVLKVDKAVEQHKKFTFKDGKEIIATIDPSNATLE